MKAALRGLYAITDGALTPAGRLAAAVEAAIAGGATLVQYRDKGTDATRRRDEVGQLRDRCRVRGVPLIVNDDIALAAATGADGVHLGRDDADPRAAREALGADAIIGISCYDDFERARAAAAAGADYIAFGSFFPSRVKPQAVRAEPELLRRARAELDLPTVAIGGINADNGATLVAAGADMLAVISALFGVDDTEAAARHFASLFDE